MVKNTYRAATSSLFGYLSFFYVIFIVFASLYPFSGWRITTPDIFGYLSEPLDFSLLKYNKLDILFNFLAYIPLGILLVLTFRNIRFGMAALFALCLSAALSLCMEALQSLLPTRTSSTFDLIWNISGACIGIVMMGFSRLREFLVSQILHWRMRLFETGKLIDAGLILILIWFLAQLMPEGGLFAVGDIELLFPSDLSTLRPPEFFIIAEAVTAACYMVALGTVCSFLFRHHLSRVVIFGIFVLTLVIKSIGFSLFFGVSEAFSWATPGAQMGLAIGTLCLMLTSFLPRRWQFTLGGITLLLGVVLVNFFPMNPYVSDSIRTWHPGNYVGLAGITRLASVSWPFLMFFYLYLYRRQRTIR